MSQSRDFKGVWIPREIWLSEELNITEKCLLVEIDSLSSLGQCFASNEHFSKFLGLSKDRISKMISSLRDKGFVEVTLVYKESSKEIEKRIITTIGYRQKQLGGIVENTDTPIGENAEDNNTSTITNTTNNTVSQSVPAAEQKPTDGQIDNLSNILEIVDNWSGKDRVSLDDDVELQQLAQQSALFVKTVIKKLYTNSQMSYILKMELTFSDIKERLELLIQKHIDIALYKTHTLCKGTNREVYFAKALLTAIVEAGFDE